jgi:hypothetical protein
MQKDSFHSVFLVIVNQGLWRYRQRKGSGQRLVEVTLSEDPPGSSRILRTFEMDQRDSEFRRSLFGRKYKS